MIVMYFISDKGCAQLFDFDDTKRERNARSLIWTGRCWAGRCWWFFCYSNAKIIEKRFYVIVCIQLLSLRINRWSWWEQRVSFDVYFWFIHSVIHTNEISTKKTVFKLVYIKKKPCLWAFFIFSSRSECPIRLASIYRDPFRMHDNGEFDKKKSKQLASWGIRIVLSFVCEWFCGFYSEKCKVCQRWNH